MKRTIGVLAVLCGALLMVENGRAQGSFAVRIAPGAVAAHMVGRLQLAADGTAQLLGYYPFVQGLPGPFFYGAAGEATAYFTFRSASFQVQAVPNGNIMMLFSSPINDTSIAVNLYYNASPSGDFTKPESFSSGQLIATFRTRRGMATAIAPSTGLEMGTLDLVSTSDFTFQGQTYNLGGFASGITMTTIYAGTPVSGSIVSPPASIAFGGSAVTIGTAAGVPPRRGR